MGATELEAKREDIRQALKMANGLHWTDILFAFGYENIAEVLEKNRKRSFVIHRQILHTYLYGQAMTLEKISGITKHNHATALHSVRKVIGLLEVGDKLLLRELEKVRKLRAPEMPFKDYGEIVSFQESVALLTLEKTFWEHFPNVPIGEVEHIARNFKPCCAVLEELPIKWMSFQEAPAIKVLPYLIGKDNQERKVNFCPSCGKNISLIKIKNQIFE